MVSYGNYEEFRFFTGLRQSKHFALQISDCDVKAGRISITKAIVDGQAKNRPKTNLDREFALCRRAPQVLHAQFALPERMIATGQIAHDFVFCTAGDPDYAFTERIVAAQKRVISQSLEAIQQPRTSIGRGSLHDEVTALKQQPGGDIICFGGVSFGAGLLEANVVDELQLYVNPYAVGSGRSIFRQPRPLQCIDATAYPCGIVVQRYRPA